MAKPPDRAPSRTLSALHLGVFGGLSALTVAVGRTEWQHLVSALQRPFHSGSPPSPTLLFAGLGAVGCAGALGLQALRGRSASLALSVGVLVCFLVSLGAPRAVSHKDLAARTPDGANVRLLGAAQAVQAVMVEALRQEGEVPAAPQAWQARVDGLGLGPSALRTRAFRALPYRVVQVGEDGQLPQPLVPGSLVVYVSPDGARFTLTPIGLDASGQPAPLSDPGGTRLVLRGVFH